eukprot:749447-Hanusia_phi.AAC.1
MARIPYLPCVLPSLTLITLINFVSSADSPVCVSYKLKAKSGQCNIQTTISSCTFLSKQASMMQNLTLIGNRVAALSSDASCRSFVDKAICKKHFGNASQARLGITCASLCSYWTFNQMYDMNMLQVLAPGQDIIPCNQDSDCSYANGRLASSYTVLPICCSYVRVSLTDLCEVSTTQVDNVMNNLGTNKVCANSYCVAARGHHMASCPLVLFFLTLSSLYTVRYLSQ